MRLLLDTNVLLWWLAAERLSDHLQQLIADPMNDVIVSAASAWEIAIKKALNKLNAPDDLEAQLIAGGFLLLPISVGHAVAAGALPRHHDDPFDRMLIAQARAEQLTLVTSDTRFGAYEVDLLG